MAMNTLQYSNQTRDRLVEHCCHQPAAALAGLYIVVMGEVMWRRILPAYL